MKTKKTKLPKLYQALGELWCNHIQQQQEQASKISEVLNECLTKFPTVPVEDAEQYTWKLVADPTFIPTTYEVTPSEVIEKYGDLLNQEAIEKLKNKNQ